jgi:hypothetical protein
MFSGKKVSIVIPCHNEETGLAEVLSQKPAFVDEVIVVNNDSTDRTGEVATSYGAKVVFLKEKGYGLAYQAGMRAASGDVILGMDGDGSYQMANVEELVRKIVIEGYDFVSGSRFPLRQKESMPGIKRISNRVFSAWLRFRFKLKLQDSQSGLFAFKKEFAELLIPHQKGMPFSQELKLNAWLSPKLRSIEIPIHYSPRSGDVKYRALQDSWQNIRAALNYVPPTSKT